MTSMKCYQKIVFLPFVWLLVCFFLPKGAMAGDGRLSLENLILSEVVIEIGGKREDSNRLERLARDLIRIEKGTVLSAKRLEESIHNLRQSGVFETIHVDSRKQDATATVFFQLKPFRLIEDIHITGAFPLFEKDVVNAMTMGPGDRFLKDKLARQAEGITRMLTSEGYPASVIKLDTEENPKSGNVVLRIDLDKGKPLILDQLVFKGNDHIASMRLRLFMKTGASFFRVGIPKRFREGHLKKDTQRIIDLYREKGFPDCTITHEVKKNGRNHVSVFIHIKEGPRYKVRFNGNHSISSRKLRRVAVGFKSGNQNDVGLKRITSGIKKIYEEAGFQNTRVTFSKKMPETQNTGSCEVVFKIDEGDRKIVESVQIKGHRFFTTERIKKQMLTEVPGWFRKGYFIPQSLEDDIYAVKALYRKNGFSATEVTSKILNGSRNDTVVIRLVIDEGKQTTVSSVQITGLTSVPVDTAYNAIDLKTRTPFRKYMMKSDENALSEMVSETGYPYVKVNGILNISEGGQKAGVVYEVDEGPPVKMGQIHFSGNFKTKEKVMLNELDLLPGKPFSLKTLLNGQKNIRDMGLFESVRFNPIGLKEQREEIQLVVDVAEKKPYFVELGIGYETQRGFFVQSKAGDRNLFGTNKDAWIEMEASQLGYSVESGMMEPRLWGSKISMNTSVFAERFKEFNQEFGTSGYGANVGFSRKLFKHLTTSLNFRFEQRDQFDGDAYELATDPKVADEFERRVFLVTTPTISVDTRDSAVYPKRGFFSSLSLDLSKGLVKSLDNFIKYRADVRAYYTPFKRLTLAWIGRVGYLDPYGSTENVPDDQLFFLGGISDVRGFDENLLLFDDEGDPLGGRTSIFGSMEARIDLGGNFELPLFFDTGRISNTFDEGIPEDFRHAVGFGLRYVTPIGPVGVLYGINLDPEEGESSGRFHFSIGYTF